MGWGEGGGGRRREDTHSVAPHPSSIVKPLSRSGGGVDVRSHAVAYSESGAEAGVGVSGKLHRRCLPGRRIHSFFELSVQASGGGMDGE